MKTTKGGKVMNPTDAYRKEIRKKELKRNKKERKKVREVGILKKDPETLREQIGKLETMKADGALDKARKHKKRQLEDTLNLVLKKRKEYEKKMHEKGETPVMFSHLGPPRRRTTAEEEERVKHPRPEDSVYYHPTLNPTGAPPPGKPPMYKSSIGPRIPLSTSSGAGASSSMSELDGMDSAIPPPPPPPPLPLTNSVESTSGNDSTIPSSLPLPPPPPAPPKTTTELNVCLPLLPLPPPPLDPQSKDIPIHAPLPPPPPLPRPLQPPPPGTSEIERDKVHNAGPDDLGLKEQDQSRNSPAPGLPLKAVNQSGGPSDSDDATKDASKMVPPPPPPRLQATLSRPPEGVTCLQPDVLPPGISQFLPPPSDMRPPPLPVPGHPSNRSLLGMGASSLPRPPFGPLPGPPPMFRPPFSSGQLLVPEDDPAVAKPSAPPKPSYVKSAASTVVKRPLAQHTPELTSMVPASVRVRRETAVLKPKPKTQLDTFKAAPRPLLVPTSKLESTGQPSAPKSHSIDDSYTAFLEDMKALGALDREA
ncbi:protein EARLY FLOWERING 5-like [Aristolochia californica]|uniref:protein EARLY FLOWERING 5-like n=1 Tax=Aristolochia californica TaxID=171875 RepID=UPI0035DFBB2F